MPNLREVEVLFGFLPSLGDLWIYGHKFGIHAQSGLPQVVDLGVLVRLDLVLCCAREAELAALLAKCANLEAFSYISMENDSLSGHGLHPDEIARLLCRSDHLPRTLRWLTLEHHPMKDSPYASTYTSLQPLKAVEELHLGAIGLLTKPQDTSRYRLTDDLPAWPQPLSSILPPNIASLNIFDGRRLEAAGE